MEGYTYTLELYGWCGGDVSMDLYGYTFNGNDEYTLYIKQCVLFILISSDYADYNSIYDVKNVITWATGIEILNGLHKADYVY